MNIHNTAHASSTVRQPYDDHHKQLEPHVPSAYHVTPHHTDTTLTGDIYSLNDGLCAHNHKAKNTHQHDNNANSDYSD